MAAVSSPHQLPVAGARPIRALRAGLAVAFLALAAPLPGDELKDLYERADKARKTGKPNLARVLFRKLLQEAPDHVEGHLGYQKVLQSERKEPDLVREYEKILEARPEPWAYYLFGRVLHDPEREETLYRKGLETAPADLRLRKALAWALRRQLRRAEAEKEYREIAELEPDVIDTQVALAYCLRETGKLEGMLSAYHDRAANEPRSLVAQLLHGIALGVLGRQDEALERLEKARDLSPDDPAALRALGLLHLKRGDADTAQPLLEKARSLDPYDAQGLAFLGHMLTFFRKDPGGLALLEEAARLEPDDTANWVLLGTARLAMKDVLGGEEAFQEAIRLEATQDNALAAMGAVHLYRGEHAQAIDFYERAIRAAGAGAAHHFSGLAKALQLAGRLEEAGAALDKAAAGESKADFQFGIGKDGLEVRARKSLPPPDLESLGRALATEGRFEEAKARFRECIRLAPDSVRAHAGLARIHHRLGELCEALDALTELRQVCETIGALADRVPLARYEVAKCLVDLGRRQEALELYRAARDEPVSSTLDVASVEETIRALEAAGAATETHRIPSVRIRQCAREDYCMPLALGAVLEHWGLTGDVDFIALKTSDGSGSRTIAAAMEYLGTLPGLKAVLFTARPAVLKDLSRKGYPAILLSQYLDEGKGEYVGHASVVAGFDDAQGAFLLEDSNWFSGVDRMSYSRADGEGAILVAPAAQMEQLVAALPDQPYWRAVLDAAAATGRDDGLEARRLLEEAVRLRPDWHAAHLHLAALCVKEGDLDAALLACERSRDLPGATAESQAMLGLIQFQKGDLDRAEESFSIAHAMAPGYVPAISGLLNVEWKRSNFSAALPLCDKLLEIRPRDGVNHYTRGILCRRLGDEAGAMDSFLVAAGLHGPAETHWYLGQYHRRRGETKRAIKDFERYRALVETPESVAEVDEVLDELRGRKRSPKE